MDSSAAKTNPGTSPGTRILRYILYCNGVLGAIKTFLEDVDVVTKQAPTVLTFLSTLTLGVGTMVVYSLMAFVPLGYLAISAVDGLIEEHKTKNTLCTLIALACLGCGVYKTFFDASTYLVPWVTRVIGSLTLGIIVWLVYQQFWVNMQKPQRSPADVGSAS